MPHWPSHGPEDTHGDHHQSAPCGPQPRAQPWPRSRGTETSFGERVGPPRASRVSPWKPPESPEGARGTRLVGVALPTAPRVPGCDPGSSWAPGVSTVQEVEDDTHAEANKSKGAALGTGKWGRPKIHHAYRTAWAGGRESMATACSGPGPPPRDPSSGTLSALHKRVEMLPA